MKELINKNPLVYIVLPCYNGEKYLLEQLMSIYYQNYTNWYLIFVNDWSTDNSENIIRDWISHYNLHEKVRVINKKNWGVMTAVQRWLEEVKSICDIKNTNSLISYCDADDIWTRDKLKIQVEYMQKHPECDLSYHDMSVTDENGVIKKKYFLKKRWPNREKKWFLYLAIMWNYISSIEMLFKAKYIDKILPMAISIPRIHQAQDYWTALVLLLLEANIQFIDIPLAYYRRWQISLQSSLKNIDIINRNENYMKYLYSLRDRFPEKDISYAIKFNEDFHINWTKKKYSLVHKLFLTLFKYPQIFYIIVKVFLWRLFKFWNVKLL